MNIDKTKGHAGETIIGMENDQIKKKRQKSLSRQ